MKFLDQRKCINVWRFIQTINEYVLFISKAYMFNSYGHTVPESVDEWNQIIIFCDALYRRKDLTENLKQLQCRTLIFVGENSQFHAEAVHMTAKLDRRYSALVEVPICTQILFYVDFRVFTYQVWCLYRYKLVARLWQRSNHTQCWYQWSTFSWDMDCTGQAR